MLLPAKAQHLMALGGWLILGKELFKSKDEVSPIYILVGGQT